MTETQPQVGKVEPFEPIFRALRAADPPITDEQWGAAFKSLSESGYAVLPITDAAKELIKSDAFNLQLQSLKAVDDADVDEWIKKRQLPPEIWHFQSFIARAQVAAIGQTVSALKGAGFIPPSGRMDGMFYGAIAVSILQYLAFNFFARNADEFFDKTVMNLNGSRETFHDWLAANQHITN